MRRTLGLASVFGIAICTVYVLTMPVIFPPDSDAIRWARWVEQPQPVWEGRHLLSWPLERATYLAWRSVSGHTRAFLPMQFLHALSGAMAVASLVVLQRLRGVRWRWAIAVGATVAFSYTWFEYGRSAHVRMPSTAVGLITLMAALAIPLTKGHLLRPLAFLALGTALSTLLQTNGIAFVFAAAIVVACRVDARLPVKCVMGFLTLSASLTVVVACYALVWSYGIPADQRPASPIEWVSAHPELSTLDVGLSPMQLARAGSGILRALGGESSVPEAVKSALLGQGGTARLSGADCLAFASGSLALLLGCIAFFLCMFLPETRVDAIACASMLLLLGGFSLTWTGSDPWIWLAPVAMLWHCVGLRTRHLPRAGLIKGLVMLLLACNMVSACRVVEAPAIVMSRSSQPVSSALAYAAATTPDDLVIGFSGWTNWVHYGLQRKALYLYEASFDPNWRDRLSSLLAGVRPPARIFVTEDVVRPRDVSTLDTWERVRRAHGMSPEEVRQILNAHGVLVYRDGMLPREPLWELVRPTPKQGSRH